jgi:hypothetical protein
MFKEVRNLLRLKEKVSFELKIAATEIRNLYPSAVRLEEAVRMYNRTCALLETDYKALSGLAAVHKCAVQKQLQRAFKPSDHILWSSHTLQEYVEKLSDATVTFQDRVRGCLLRGWIASVYDGCDVRPG